MATQTKFGKGFEYACLISFYNQLKDRGMTVEIDDNLVVQTAEKNFSQLEPDNQIRMLLAASAAIPSLIKAEPNLTNGEEAISLTILKDSSGAEGDVRDVVFLKNETGWEIGISCKHNHHALKHSRLSNKIDFGQKWLNIPVSSTYFSEINPIFSRLEALRDQTKHLDKADQNRWDIIDDKEEEVYIPILNAFRSELLALAKQDQTVPLRLVEYLLGEKDFYKIIAEEKDEKTIIQAFNIHNSLSQSYQGIKARLKSRDFSTILPTTIYHFDYKTGSKNTLILVMDNGWTISFRIHNASSRIEPSLKFDIQLIGFPSAVTNIENYWGE